MCSWLLHNQPKRFSPRQLHPFRTISIPRQDGRGPGIRMARSPWKGQERRTARKQKSKSQQQDSQPISLFYLQHQSYDKILSIMCPFRRVRDARNRRTVCPSVFHSSWLTDRTFPYLATRCITIRISNLIVYTNFIYVTWVHFYPATVGWKLEDPDRPEDIGKWSMSICNCLMSLCSFHSYFRLGCGVVVPGSPRGLHKKVDLLGRYRDQ